MTSRKLAILVLLAIITVSWWFVAGQRGTEEGKPPGVAASAPSPPALEPPEPKPLPTPVADTAPAVRTRALPNPAGTDFIIPAIPLETGELGWEKTIRDVTSDKKVSDAEKGRRLLETIPTMPVEGRETAAEEAIKRIPDTDYRPAQLALSNPATFGTAVGVLFADLMNRPDEIRLPTLLTIARNPEHPYAPNARDNLNLILGKDHGTDWTAWDAAIRQRLAARQ